MSRKRVGLYRRRGRFSNRVYYTGRIPGVGHVVLVKNARKRKGEAHLFLYLSESRQGSGEISGRGPQTY